MRLILLKLDFFIDLGFFYSFHQGDGFSVHFILQVNPYLECTSYLRVFSAVSGGDG